MGSLSLSVPSSRQGLVLGVNQAVMAAANILGPLVGNALIGAQLYTSWASAIGGMMVLSGLMAFVLMKNFPHIFHHGRLGINAEASKAIQIME